MGAGPDPTPWTGAAVPRPMLPTRLPAAARPPPTGEPAYCAYAAAASTTACVQAPTGSAEITGVDALPSSTSTVRA